MCESMHGAHRENEYGKALDEGKWVYNNYPGAPRLHKTSCAHIGAFKPGILNYEKIVCAGPLTCILTTLESRGLAAISGGCCGIPIHRVGNVVATPSKRMPSSGLPKTSTYPNGLPSPCRESYVEAEVSEYLRSAGYDLRPQAPGPNGGFIDFVATKPSERLVVEAKGEDKGGYGTAEMNFQMGLGQLAGRLTDDAALYFLAFPLTPNFRQVLGKYRNSLAFGRVGVGALVLHAPGDVRRYEPTQVQTFVDGLWHMAT